LRIAYCLAYSLAHSVLDISPELARIQKWHVSGCIIT